MVTKRYKPTSNGQRNMTVSGFEEITSKASEKSLLVKKNKQYQKFIDYYLEDADFRNIYYPLTT